MLEFVNSYHDQFLEGHPSKYCEHDKAPPFDKLIDDNLKDELITGEYFCKSNCYTPCKTG